jgi:hypothetical protein
MLINCRRASSGLHPSSKRVLDIDLASYTKSHRSEPIRPMTHRTVVNHCMNQKAPGLRAIIVFIANPRSRDEISSNDIAIADLYHSPC